MGRGRLASGWIAAVFCGLGCGLTGSFDLDEGTGSTTVSAETATVSTGESSSSGSDDTTAEVPLDCGGVQLRLATHNVQDIGTVGSDEYTALEAILARIDADIVCLQEVRYWETPELQALGGDVGYEHVIQAERSPAIGGSITNACLGRVPLELVGSFSGADLSTDPTANDVGRDILVVRARPTPACRVGVITAHLKAGEEPVDLFRRQVEVERVVQAVERYRELGPDEPLFVLGDFNETPSAAAIGTELTSIPGGLPSSYELGRDISLPLTYDPLGRVAAAGLVLGQPKQEDSEATSTWNDAARLDYVFFDGVVLAGDEVYDACQDNGVDDDPPGGWLEKAGEPVECSASALASDHFPVFADFALM